MAASESEASCDEDPNFAVICAFFEKFGELLGVTDIDICELQSMLESTNEVSKSLMDLHVKLLRKIKKSVHVERWEKSLIKFSHTFSSKDAWELERFGYKTAKLSSKVRILKELLEAQFDYNSKFKSEINKLSSNNLRAQPLGRDKFGHAYWFQSDDNYHIRVFKEDLDDEKWTLVARDRVGLVSLITNLSDGDIKISSDSAGNEDSNSLSEKPIIDTGQQDTDSKKTSEDEDSNLETKNKDQEEDKSTPVLKIKSLGDLMPSPKRPREEVDEETIFDKYNIKNLEIRVSKVPKRTTEPVVGEAIEEPVMKIEGEGSGQDNESPIVGETIEEDIMYFYGNGSGHDCQTGNQPEKEESTETSNAVDKPNSTKENIPKQQSDSSTSKSNESSQSKDSSSSSPKKFFFGSSSSPFKSNSLSSTVAFGSPKMDKDGDKNHLEQTSIIEENIVDNKNVNINESKASEEVSMETKSKNNEIMDLLEEPKEKLQGSKKETDIVDNSLQGSTKKDDIESNNSAEGIESKETEMEPICVKKFAYICGKNDESEKVVDKKGDRVSIETIEAVKRPETVNANETVKDDAVETPDFVEKTEPVKAVETTDTDKTTETLITAKDAKTLDTVKTPDNSSIKSCEETKNNPQDAKTNGEEGSLDSNVVVADKDPLSNPASEETDNAEKPETKSISSNSVPDSKANSDPNDTEDEVQPEVVFVAGRTRGKKLVKVAAKASEKTVRPIKKAGKGGAKKKKADPLENNEKVDKDEEKNKLNSAESSIPNSPAMSLGDASVISIGEITAGDSCDADVAAADPLAVSDAEGDSKPAATGATISSFSLDFDDSPQKPVKIPIVPSPMRAVRKRGREIIALKATEADNGPGKRMKLKGRRQVDTALRKSVEQRIEQLHGSSSESKDSETEQNPKNKKKASRPKKSPLKKGRKLTPSPTDVDVKPKKPIKRDPAKKNSRLLAGLVIEECFDDRPVLRQSRRLAQLKIKEQVEPAKSVKEEVKKKTSKGDSKLDKPEKRKRDKKGKSEEDVSEPEVVIESKKKKKKEKPLSRMFNENRPWQSSSEDSEDVAEEEEEEEIAEEDDAPLGDLKSDHEFSPESDLEDDKGYQPMKRARTAKKESDEEEADEFPCQKCGKDDHPEWILLCDKCDIGWHCSCLRPPLLVIPEGDWFCPPCQHIILLEQLQAKLIEYDKKLSKKEVEDRRKERLAYVGISLNNVLPTKEHVDHRKKKRRHSASGSNSSSSESAQSVSESESDSDEPIYQLRQRRQTKNYKFNEYDEMIKTAIGEDADKPEDTAGNLGRGKDIQTIVKGLEPEPEAEKGDEDCDRPSVTNLKKMLRKKHRKLNSLEFDSEEEDISDEDFKGSSDESEEEDDEPDESDSDDCLGKKRRKNLPTRRSTRARTRRFEADFINDDSDDEAPKRKKKKSIWDDDTTTESDASGYGPKEKKKKKKKKKRREDSDDEPNVKKNRPRIKYGGLTSSEEEELGKGRRTRGKKTTYVDTLGSDSEEEQEQTKKNPRRIDSDDDEDFVANDEEVEDEDKDSDDRGEPAVEEEEEEPDSEQERREKRSLLVPKIYIKKPLGEKKQRELEAAKAKAMNVETDSNSDKKIEEKNEEEKINNKGEQETQSNKNEEKVPTTEDSETGENELDFEVKKPKIEEAKKDTEHVSKELKSITGTVKTETEVEETEAEIKKVTELQPANIPIMECSVALTKLPAKRGRKPKIMHEPIISNVNSLFKNDEDNDDLSEPPGISLPNFDDMSSSSSNSKESLTPETPKKRRGRGPGKKKSLEETLSSIGTKISPTKASEPAIEIAAPPQPFSQAQPTPSVITRMLQSKPGISIYPVGRIRPKQFATMRDDDSDESSPKNSPASSPAAPVGGPPHQYMSGGPRGPPPMVGPYRAHGPPHPGMNHYPRGPPGYRGPPPPQGMLPHPYSNHPSHRSMDPSPSGGGPINLTDPGQGPPLGGPMPGPGRGSPGRRGPPVSRYPPVSQTSPGPRPQMQLPPQQPYPPPPNSSNGPPLVQQAYHTPPSNNATTPQQPYPPRPSSNNPPHQPYPSPNSSSGPPLPHQTFSPSSTSNSGPPPQQPYPPRPAVSNGPPQQAYHPPLGSSNGPPQQGYPPPPSNSGPPPQQAYPPRPSSNSGPPTPQQSYSPRPSSANSGPSATQPPEGYYGNYPPPASEEPAPSASYQGVPPSANSPYPEPYSGEEQPAVVPPPDNTNSKAYEDETGGEFAGLASYFSSQRDDELDS